MAETEQATVTPSQPFDDPAFLEPPHHHNLLDLLNSTSPPPGLIRLTDSDLRDAIQAITMSTSIMFASLKRLRLCEQDHHVTVHRIWSGSNMSGDSTETPIAQCSITSSEPACFNSTMRLQAEWLYFNEEALPDWHIKSHLVNAYLRKIDKTSPARQIGLEAVIIAWWSALRNVVSSWVIEARQISADITTRV